MLEELYDQEVRNVSAHLRDVGREAIAAMFSLHHEMAVDRVRFERPRPH
ncbi:MAG: hypothetical protein RIC16_07135 [Rhodospirillales bacterium]